MLNQPKRICQAGISFCFMPAARGRYSRCGRRNRLCLARTRVSSRHCRRVCWSARCVLRLWHSPPAHRCSGACRSVAAQHLSCHRFAEAAWTRHTAEPQFCVQRAINHWYKPWLIHIFTVAGRLEVVVAEIDVIVHFSVFFVSDCKNTKIIEYERFFLSFFLKTLCA